MANHRSAHIRRSPWGEVEQVEGKKDRTRNVMRRASRCVRRRCLEHVRREDPAGSRGSLPYCLAQERGEDSVAVVFRGSHDEGRVDAGDTPAAVVVCRLLLVLGLPLLRHCPTDSVCRVTRRPSAPSTSPPATQQVRMIYPETIGHPGKSDL